MLQRVLLLQQLLPVQSDLLQLFVQSLQLDLLLLNAQLLRHQLLQNHDTNTAEGHGRSASGSERPTSPGVCPRHQN